MSLGIVLAALFGPQFWTWGHRPILTLAHQSLEPFVRVTTLEDGRHCQWVRVRVENVGRSPARGCLGIVASVATEGRTRPDIDPLQVRWAGVPRARGFEPITLSRGEAAYLNVVMSRDGEHAMEFDTFNEDFDPGFPTCLSSSASHEVRVTVSSDTADPVSLAIAFPRRAEPSGSQPHLV